VVHEELESLLVIVALQRVSIVILAKQGLERIGRQHEVWNVRRVVALDRNALASFCIVRRNSRCAIPFRYNRTLPIHTCQSDTTLVLVSAPLEPPKNRLVVRSGCLGSSI